MVFEAPCSIFPASQHLGMGLRRILRAPSSIGAAEELRKRDWEFLQFLSSSQHGSLTF